MQADILRTTTGAAEPPTVLVIDDEESVVRIIRLFLKPYGFSVAHALCYAAARRHAATARAILCDMHLGEENGIDVIRQLRGDGYAGPAIMISGDRCSDAVRRSLGADVSGYIVKPFHSAALLQELRRHPGLIADPEPGAAAAQRGGCEPRDGRPADEEIIGRHA